MSLVSLALKEGERRKWNKLPAKVLRGNGVWSLPDAPDYAAGATRVECNQIAYKVSCLYIPQLDSAIIGAGNHKARVELQASHC